MTRDARGRFRRAAAVQRGYCPICARQAEVTAAVRKGLRETYGHPWRWATPCRSMMSRGVVFDGVLDNTRQAWQDQHTR